MESHHLFRPGSHPGSIIIRNSPLEDGTNRGALKIYSTNDENLFAYSRIRGDNEVLILLNFAQVPKRLRFTQDVPEGKFKDYLNGGGREFSTTDGISLHENGYAIFVK